MTNRSISQLQARIVTGTFCAHIEGVPLDVISPVLEAVTPAPRRGGASGYKLAFVRDCHYEVDAGGRIIFMAGLVPRVVARLEQMGYRVKVQNRTLWESLLNADHAMRASGDETAEDRQFFDALAVNPRGLVVVHNDADAAWLIAKLGSFFPTAHMLIVATTEERVQQFYAVLNKCCVHPVRRTLEGLWSMPVRTYVCTQATFSMCTAQDWNIVVFTEPESALALLSEKNLAQMFREARADMRGLLTYCFVRADRSLGRRARLRLEAVCGGEIYRQPEPGGPLASVAVLIARTPQCPPLPRHATLADKRSLWQSAPRNAAIAWLATVIASGNRAAIKACGLLHCLPAGIAGLAVAILVESTVQGRELLKLLPGWQLRHEVPALGEVAGGRSHLSVTDRIISTYMYAQRNGVLADIFIRADGASEWPLAPGAFPRRARGAGDRAVVIDLVGDGGSGGGSGFHRRIGHYAQLGWNVEGPVDVVLGNAVKRPARTRKVAVSRRCG
jgi:hypothetical protein